MPERGEQLAKLDDAAVFDNGQIVAFTIKTTEGKRLRVHCPLAELGDIFLYLGHLAKHAGKMRGAAALPIPQAHNYLAPIPADGIALQIAGSPEGEALLILRLPGFDMAFSLPTDGIVHVADDFVRAARTLLGHKDTSTN